MKRRNRMIVIGLDGGEWNIIRYLMKKEVLPNISKFVETGVSGHLKSTLPPVTAPAWSSFMTGKNPGNHGLYNFTTFKRGTYEHELVNRTFIKSKTLWRILSEEGKRSIVINCPITYPPEKINGIVVSGLLSPEGSDFYFPEEVGQYIENDYIIDVNRHPVNNTADYFDSVINMTKQRGEIALKLIKDRNWDFFMVVFVGADRLQHVMWGNRKKIYEYYKYFDHILGEVINICPESYQFLMSDHGFKEIKGTFYVNEWLSQIGMLKKSYVIRDSGSTPDTVAKLIQQRDGTELHKSKALGYLKEFVKGVLPNSGIQVLKKLLPQNVRNLGVSKSLKINWRNTNAYCFSSESFAINVNLEGREAKGIVKQSEYEEIRNLICQELEKVVDPRTGEKIIEEVYKGNELNAGAFSHDAPDIIAIPQDMKYTFSGSASPTGQYIIRRSGLAIHALEGIFAARGPEIRTGQTLDNVRIIDIMPSILHILNVPIPSDCDGRVLIEVFEKTSALHSQDVSHGPPSRIEGTESTNQMAKAYEEAVKERLKGLGYLD